MKTVYIAGKYNDTNVIDVLKNIRTGIEAGSYLMRHGFAPYCPFLDFQFALAMDGEFIEVDDFKACSMAFVPLCDMMLMLDSWKDSKGAIAEGKLALELGKKIYYSVTELIETEAT